MKQKLILITGSPCVGKTAAAERLFGLCEDSAYFDGDWGWCVNPFRWTTRGCGTGTGRSRSRCQIISSRDSDM